MAPVDDCGAGECEREEQVSAKYFCDACGKEMRASDFNRLTVTLGDFKAEVITALRGTWNGGHICHACVRRLVSDGAKVRK